MNHLHQQHQPLHHTVTSEHNTLRARFIARWNTLIFSNTLRHHEHKKSPPPSRTALKYRSQCSLNTTLQTHYMYTTTYTQTTPNNSWHHQNMCTNNISWPYRTTLPPSLPVHYLCFTLHTVHYHCTAYNTTLITVQYKKRCAHTVQCLMWRERQNRNTHKYDTYMSW